MTEARPVSVGLASEWAGHQSLDGGFDRQVAVEDGGDRFDDRHQDGVVAGGGAGGGGRGGRPPGGGGGGGKRPAGTDAGGDGENVLDRAADFDADHVGLGVGPKRRAAEEAAEVEG